MTQAERMEKAKDLTVEFINTEEFDQCGDWSFAMLHEIDGEEQWVVVEIKAKKNFDIDEEIDNWEFEKKQKQIKLAEKQKKKLEKTVKK